MNILFISLAPVFIILLYVYYRDKYEREPWKMLLKALVIGGLVSVPTIFVEMFLSSFAPESKISNAAYTAFVVAGFTEESLKYLAFILIIWNSKHFNEKFDGIVYAVFISLGFAGIENIIYVSEGNSTQLEFFVHLQQFLLMLYLELPWGTILDWPVFSQIIESYI